MVCEIRKGTIEDVIAIIPLQQAFVAEHIQYDPMYYATLPEHAQIWSDWARQRVTEEDFALFVAEEEKRMIGYVSGWIEKRSPLYVESRVGYLSNMYVIPEKRREGVGRELVKQLFAWFKEKKMNHTELFVDTRAENAIQFWKSIGYVPHLLRMRCSLDTNQ